MTDRTYAKGSPIELKFDGTEMQKWNIPMDRSQKADEKNGVISLVIMFTPGVMVIKMSSGSCFVLSADDSKILINHTLDKIFKCIWKIIFNSFRRYYGLVNSELPLACQPLTMVGFSIFADSAVFSVIYFICTCPNCYYFLLSSVENIKNEPFWTF